MSLGVLGKHFSVRVCIRLSLPYVVHGHFQLEPHAVGPPVPQVIKKLAVESLVQLALFIALAFQPSLQTRFYRVRKGCFLSGLDRLSVLPHALGVLHELLVQEVVVPVLFCRLCLRPVSLQIGK